MSIGILEEYRRKNYGSKLIEHLKNTDSDKISLYVQVNNTKAINFYERNGMKCVGDIAWKNNTLPGKVFLYTTPNNLYEKFALL